MVRIWNGDCINNKIVVMVLDSNNGINYINGVNDCGGDKDDS